MPTTVLSPGERDVIALLVLGNSNKEIARTLDRTEDAVEIATRRIYKKMGVRNRTQAAVAYTKEQCNG